MPKTTAPKYTLLPARMNIIRPESLNDWQIMVLDFPIKDELRSFQNTLSITLNKKHLDNDEVPPFRRLNNALLSLTSTITHGFEWYGNNYLMLAIKPKSGNEALAELPEPAKIFEVIKCWLIDWVETRFKDKNIIANHETAWRKLITALEQAKNTWRLVDPQVLLTDLESSNGLSYQAIGSILATILHNKTSIIETKNRTRIIHWRKATSGGKHGLFVLSKPFKATYAVEQKTGEKKTKEKTGYFAYKIEFLVQTQVARFYPGTKKLKPWLFIRVGIQRYSNLPVKPNYGRNVSFMVRLNRERLDGFEVDSTLVRLEAERSYDTKQVGWVTGLPDLIQRQTVRKLVNPQDILNDPENYANFGDNPDFLDDEYYVVHAEGFKQLPKADKAPSKDGEEELRPVKHSVLTGNSFIERRKIIASLLEYFKDILEPDIPMSSDGIGTVTDSKKKGALRDFGDISKGCASLEPSARDKKSAQSRGKEPDIEKRRERRTAVQGDLAEAIKQATQGKPVQLNIIWHNQAACKQIRSSLRNALLLNEQDELPSNVQVEDFQASYELLEPLAGSKFNKEKAKLKEIRSEVARAHGARVDLWSQFLKQKITREDCYNLVLAELPKLNLKEYYSIQGIKGAVREACARRGFSSQMIRPVRTKDKNGELVILKKSETENRILTALRELLYRHTGALFGPPKELFQKAGIPAEIAENLDIIAFCRLESNKANIHYALAVRLRATGEVEVLLHQHETWLPYITAGAALGKFFGQERGKLKKQRNSYSESSPLQLKGGHLARFVAQVLSQKLERPTLALIEAEKWRNGKQNENDNKGWVQLQNDKLADQLELLDFTHLSGFSLPYPRQGSYMQNLLGIIRIRQGNESPQYVAQSAGWQDKTKTQDFDHLTGFLDKSIPGVLHYFSVGKLPKTQKKQKGVNLFDKLKIESEGAATSYKHQQMLELVPFFIRPDFQQPEQKLALCRVAHFLRVNPAWGMGNTVLPYPMHLGETLIKDQVCIVHLEE